ncbi:hypothetical protein NFIA_093030 [Paecilomyces variotii No. 5]|uniref:Hydrophobic surface binding protein A-domain-containing protein n=1 Tax=Byssochlamys spectabilis (strain No. 5 / NBRC 109023) TaxID=1356009 RepID=V5FLV1_BYSSN|nr:hypothetical protein NFIA_093030 [Paecilomyces variotii No. 5]
MVASQLFQAVITVYLIGVAFTAPILKPDAATVLSDLSTISKNLETLDSNILKFDGSRSKAVPLSESASALMREMDKTIIDTNKSAVFEPTDSATVTRAAAAIEPLILKSLNDISAKHSTIVSANQGGVTFGRLASLRTLTDQFAQVLESKLTPTNASNIASATSDVDSAYSSAIALYMSTGRGASSHSQTD